MVTRPGLFNIGKNNNIFCNVIPKINRPSDKVMYIRLPYIRKSICVMLHVEINGQYLFTVFSLVGFLLIASKFMLVSSAPGVPCGKF